MKDFVWFLAIALLALPGTIVWRVPLIARMTRGARWAFAFVAGLLIAALLLYVYALLHIEWSRAAIAILLATIAAAAFVSNGGQPTSAVPPRRGQPGSAVLHWIFLLVTLYAIADARATCGDLMYIWGPKAQAFFTARTIDHAFLATPYYSLMHPDYPPLVPLVYDVGSIFAHAWSWWGPLFIALLMLASMIGVLRGFGAPTTLFTAVMCFVFVSAYLPGAADPFLLLFESVAVMALTFAPQSRDARWIAAIALAAAAFTKVEGTTFAIIVAIAFALTQRRIRQAIAILIPAAILLGSWLLYAAHYKLLDQYARAHGAMYWNRLPTVISDTFDRASYHAFWLPWIAAVAPLFVTRSWRRAALPLLVAAASIASTIFFYLHDPNPSFWIVTSADRILATPLMCLAVASAATWNAVEADRLADAPVLGAA